jgi:hypothetical protein
MICQQIISSVFFKYLKTFQVFKYLSTKSIDRQRSIDLVNSLRACGPPLVIAFRPRKCYALNRDGESANFHELVSAVSENGSFLIR